MCGHRYYLWCRLSQVYTVPAPSVTLRQIEFLALPAHAHVSMRPRYLRSSVEPQILTMFFCARMLINQEPDACSREIMVPTDT